MFSHREYCFVFFLSSPGSSRAKRTNYQHWQLSHIRSISISFCSTDRRQRIASNRRTVSSQCPPAGILSLLLRFVREASKDEKWNACLKAETGNAWKIAMFRVERREFFNLSDCHPEILCENSSLQSTMKKVTLREFSFISISNKRNWGNDNKMYFLSNLFHSFIMIHRAALHWERKKSIG